MSVNVRDSMSETQCARLNVGDAMSQTHRQRLIVCDPMSEIQCQRLNVGDPMSETQCQRLNVTVEFTNLVTHLCYTAHRGVHCDIGVLRDSGFARYSSPSLDCWKTFSECRPATHSIYILHHHLLNRETDFFGPVQNAGMPSPWKKWWCQNEDCLADIRAAECIWGSLSGYNGCHANIGWSEWIGKDWTCHIPSSTRCAQTHTQWDDHSNTDCYCDANMRVDPVEKAPRIEVRRIWRSKLLVRWDRSE